MAKMKINKGRSQLLDVDWSVISVSSIRMVFEELICQLMGVDRPLERWRGADVNDVYRRYSTAALGNSSTGFPIKGVIYDMLCFMQRTPSNTISPIASSSVSDGGRDWSNLIPAFTNTSTNACPTAVTASEVVQRLGVQNLPGLQDKILTESKERLAKKQMLEEVMGRGDSVRDKYMEKIRAKKMTAQARRERERFSINTNTDAYTAQSSLSQKAWSITRSSPALVRYLEERGIRQALIARGDQSQLNELLEELRDYKFQYLKNLEMEETGKSTSEVTNSANHYIEVLKSFCAIWGLPPWQVLLATADVSGGHEGVPSSGVDKGKGVAIDDVPTPVQERRVTCILIQSDSPIVTLIMREGPRESFVSLLTQPTIPEEGSPDVRVGIVGMVPSLPRTYARTPDRGRRSRD